MDEEEIDKEEIDKEETGKEEINGQRIKRTERNKSRNKCSVFMNRLLRAHTL